MIIHEEKRQEIHAVMSKALDEVFLAYVERLTPGAPLVDAAVKLDLVLVNKETLQKTFYMESKVVTLTPVVRDDLRLKIRTNLDGLFLSAEKLGGLECFEGHLSLKIQPNLEILCHPTVLLAAPVVPLEKMGRAYVGNISR